MLVGWDEIAHDDLPRTSVVQSWRGGPSRDRAVAQGFDCIFSAGLLPRLLLSSRSALRLRPGEPCRRICSRATNRFAPIRALRTFATGWDGPAILQGAVRSTVEPGQSPPGRVLGGEACMWAELVTDDIFEVRVWGRLPAIAERFWSPRSHT